MKMPVLVGALCLASFASLAAQQPTLSARNIDLVVEKASFESVIQMVAAASGVTIEFDDRIPAALRSREVGHVRFAGTDFETAMQFLTRFTKLTYTVLTPTSIRLELPPAAR